MIQHAWWYGFITMYALFFNFSDGYSQCVISEEKNNDTNEDIADLETKPNIADPKEQLSHVCEAFGGSWKKDLALDKHNCSDDHPEKCPKHALCCQNQCFATVGDNTVYHLPEFRCNGKLWVFYSTFAIQEPSLA